MKIQFCILLWLLCGTVHAADKATPSELGNAPEPVMMEGVVLTAGGEPDYNLIPQAPSNKPTDPPAGGTVTTNAADQCRGAEMELARSKHRYCAGRPRFSRQVLRPKQPEQPGRGSGNSYAGLVCRRAVMARRRGARGRS